MKKYRLTTASRILIFILLAAVLAGGAFFASKFIGGDSPVDDIPGTPGTSQNSSTENPSQKPSSKPASNNKTDAADDTIRLSMDEWVGFTPIIEANGGLTTQPGSIFDQKGIKVEINIINDPTESSNAFIKGDLNAAGYTTNRIAFLSDKFSSANTEFVVPIFTNYSNGGDGIIAKNGINNVEDLVGKKIGVPRFSEAQTLIIWFVNNSDLSDADKRSIIDNLILFDDAGAAGEAFYAGQLEVAATWQPYLSYAVDSTDAHVMFSTKASKSLIMDAIIFRQDFAEKYPDTVTAFMDGVFEANALTTHNFEVIRSVMPMFAESTDDEIIAQMADAQMTDYAENKKILSSDAPTVYAQMCNIWESIGETTNRKLGLTIFDNKYGEPLGNKYSSTVIDHNTVKVTEENRDEIINYTSLLSKSVTIEFVPNVADFLEPASAYETLDEFVEIANTLNGAIIQIEGNINATNYSEGGQKLSLSRAETVANYLIMSGISPDRIITIGNGNTKMVADVNSADAHLNRRTDIFFKIIEE